MMSQTREVDTREMKQSTMVILFSDWNRWSEKNENKIMRNTGVRLG